MINVYIDPKTCTACKYRPYLRTLGKYCQLNGLKMNLVETIKEEALATLPYVQTPSGELVPLVQITSKITAEW